MSKYRVLINGENFLINFDGQVQKVGFYTSRIVDAQNPEEAELTSVALVKGDSALKGFVLNERDDSPMLYAEEIEEIEKSGSQKNVNTGFSWYTEDEA
jgi:hypothetical protein